MCQYYFLEVINVAVMSRLTNSKAQQFVIVFAIIVINIITIIVAVVVIFIIMRY